MIKPLAVLQLLPWLDWLALAVFFGGWTGYAALAKQRAHTWRSLLAVTNAERRLWMLQTTYRENRMVDAVVMQGMSSSTSFFASTTILIIGGLLAVLSASEKTTELVHELPFAARTSVLVFDLKLLLLTGVFIYAFFRFTWSLRQSNFSALLIASAPESKQIEALGEGAAAVREAFADRNGRLVALAAETFNDGLRSYYFAFAVVAWFFSPFAFMLATAGVVFILYQREFRSDVLAILNEAGGEVR